MRRGCPASTTGSFFDYPLRPVNALRGLGLIEVGAGGGQLLRPSSSRSRTKALRGWVVNRFGRRLFEIFFKTYTEKVWGMPCTEISADWAAQRIKNLDLGPPQERLPRHGTEGARSHEPDRPLRLPASRPRHDVGAVPDLAATPASRPFAVARGACHHDGGRVSAVDARAEAELAAGCSSLISSMPIGSLIRAWIPPHRRRSEAAESLRYRDFLIVGLIVERDHLFPDNWIYIHSPEVASAVFRTSRTGALRWSTTRS